MTIRKIAIHAGHNPDGMIACGAVGVLKESTCAREIVAILETMLKADGYEVVNTTCNNGTGQTDVLKKITAATNAAKPDLSISVHLNATAEHKAGGTMCFYWHTNEETKVISNRICERICERIGTQNRGAVSNSGLYVLKNINAPSILVETLFCDNTGDAQKYDPRLIADGIRAAINEISGMTANAPDVPNFVPDYASLYRVQVGAYSVKDNATKMADKLKAAGYDCFITQS